MLIIDINNSYDHFVSLLIKARLGTIPNLIIIPEKVSNIVGISTQFSC